MKFLALLVFLPALILSSPLTSDLVDNSWEDGPESFTLSPSNTTRVSPTPTSKNYETTGTDADMGSSTPNSTPLDVEVVTLNLPSNVSQEVLLPQLLRMMEEKLNEIEEQALEKYRYEQRMKEYLDQENNRNRSSKISTNLNSLDVDSSTIAEYPTNTTPMDSTTTDNGSVDSSEETGTSPATPETSFLLPVKQEDVADPFMNRYAPTSENYLTQRPQQSQESSSELQQVRDTDADQDAPKSIEIPTKKLYAVHLYKNQQVSVPETDTEEVTTEKYKRNQIKKMIDQITFDKDPPSVPLNGQDEVASSPMDSSSSIPTTSSNKQGQKYFFLIKKPLMTPRPLYPYQTPYLALPHYMTPPPETVQDSEEETPIGSDSMTKMMPVGPYQMTDDRWNSRNNMYPQQNIQALPNAYQASYVYRNGFPFSQSFSNAQAHSYNTDPEAQSAAQSMSVGSIQPGSWQQQQPYSNLNNFQNAQPNMYPQMPMGFYQKQYGNGISQSWNQLAAPSMYSNNGPYDNLNPNYFNRQPSFYGVYGPRPVYPY